MSIARKLHVAHHRMAPWFRRFGATSLCALCRRVPAFSYFFVAPAMVMLPAAERRSREGTQRCRRWAVRTGGLDIVIAQSFHRRETGPEPCHPKALKTR